MIAATASSPVVLECCALEGVQSLVAAIKEETSAEIEQHGAAAVYWLRWGNCPS